MSRAAVDFRSPLSSPPQMQSKQQPFTRQTPNSNNHFHFDFSPFSSNNLPEQHQSSLRSGSEATDSSSFAKGNDGVFNGGLPLPFVSRMSSEKSISSVSGRSKPRLVKMRRHIGSLQGKSASVPAQTDPGLNRFHSVSGNSNHVKNDTSSKSCGYSDSIGDVMYGKLNNACFVFGASQSSLLSNLNSGNSQSSVGIEQASTDGLGSFDNEGLGFGVRKSNLYSNSNSEQSGATEFGKFGNVRNLFGADKNSSLLGLNLENRQCSARSRDDEFMKFGKVGSLFSANKSSSVTNSNSEKNQSGGSVQWSGVNDVSFVFGANKSKLVSNEKSEQGASSKNMGQEHVEELKKFENGGYVSGGSKSSFTLNTNLEKRQYNESSGKSEAGNYAGFADNYIGTSNSFINTTCASGTSTVSKLSDEMRKMAVGGCGKIECCDSSKGPSARSNHTFVFGSDKKSPFCAGESITSTSSQMNIENLQHPLDGGAFQKTNRVNVTTIEENTFVFASSCNAAQHVMPNENNQSTSSMLGVLDEQIKLGSHFGSFQEEKQPVNVNMKNFGDPSVVKSIPKPFFFQAGLGKSSDGPRDQLNDDPKLNITPTKSFEVCSAGRVENKDGFTFLSTAVGVGESTADFRITNVDASCSFAENLFSQLNKDSEFSGNSRSVRGKGWKKTRGKLRHSIPVQQQSRQNSVSKQGSQCNLESPVCYSPMDFSPSQDNNCALTAVNAACSTLEKEENVAVASTGTCISERNFTFSAPSTQDNLSATKRQNRKKYRMKVSHGPHDSNSSKKVDTASSSVQLPMQAHDMESGFNSQGKWDNKSRGDEKHDKQGFTAETQEACEKWRIRGNQAYEKGYQSRAEECYTMGINCVPHSETSGCCIEPLMLCYSNRAAARMSCGRIREALGDCMMAAQLDPHFHKVHIRAANCHLALGEVEGALQYFSKCLESGSDVCLDRRIIIEAANGQQKAQKVAKCMNQCAELLQQRTYDAAMSSLEIISTGLSISSHSEKLLELKGEALFMLQRYTEVIQLCEQTLEFAEKNGAIAACGNKLVNVDGLKCNKSGIRLWRWRLMSKSYFHLGRLEVALDLMEKLEFLRSSEDRCGSSSQESFAVTVRELLRRKSAGNEAFQSGKHTEAVEHYTAVVSNCIESRPFAAICFCNRAAAHQALAQISDAIADCSVAIALDESYSKAISRRAILHETIRDYEQAAVDLQRLISLLEKQSQKKGQQSGTPDRPTDRDDKELTKARRLLYSVEEKAKKGNSLDHYLILGIKSSATAAEIKKAYRKAALRHHPDKAGQFLARSDSRDDGKLWKEIADEVHKDAERLFKMIGEAYAVLSDPTKRSQYDHQEELRNTQKECNGSRASRGQSDFYRSPSTSSGNTQYW